MIINSDLDEILHYGVKGMKWGVRKDNSSNHAKSGSPTIVGAAALSTLFLAGKMTVAVQSGQVRSLSRRGRAIFSSKSATDFKRNERLARKDLSSDEIYQAVVKPINPGYGERGTKSNCRRATFAYEMRRRGYDVKATRTSTAEGGTAAGLLNAMSPGEKLRNTTIVSTYRQRDKELRSKVNPKPLSDLMSTMDAGARSGISSPNADNVFKALDKEPNGSRGELNVQFKGAGSHSIVYERIKGRTVLFDTQNGMTFKTPSDYRTKGYGDHLEKAGYTRLDNQSLNHDFLLRWVTDV